VRAAELGRQLSELLPARRRACPHCLDLAGRGAGNRQNSSGTWSAETARPSIYRGRLNVCEGDDRCFTRMGDDGKVESLVDNYKGRRFNRPNDVNLGIYILDSLAPLWYEDERRSGLLPVPTALRPRNVWSHRGRNLNGPRLRSNKVEHFYLAKSRPPAPKMRPPPPQDARGGQPRSPNSPSRPPISSPPPNPPSRQPPKR
jgi:hypothetical protein